MEKLISIIVSVFLFLFKKLIKDNLPSFKITKKGMQKRIVKTTRKSFRHQRSFEFTIYIMSSTFILSTPLTLYFWIRADFGSTDIFTILIPVSLTLLFIVPKFHEFNISTIDKFRGLQSLYLENLNEDLEHPNEID